MIRARSALSHNIRRTPVYQSNHLLQLQQRSISTTPLVQNQYNQKPNLDFKDYEITFHRQRQCKFHLSINPKQKIYMMIDTSKTGNRSFSWEGGSPRDKAILFISMYFLGVAVLSTISAAISIIFSPFGFLIGLGVMAVLYI